MIGLIVNDYVAWRLRCVKLLLFYARQMHSMFLRNVIKVIYCKLFCYRSEWEHAVQATACKQTKCYVRTSVALSLNRKMVLVILVSWLSRRLYVHRFHVSNSGLRWCGNCYSKRFEYKSTLCPRSSHWEGNFPRGKNLFLICNGL